jgi:ribonuclease D
MTQYHLHRGDLPNDLKLGHEIAIDSETLGLNNNRDRLCLIQLSDGNGEAHIVQFDKDKYDAPNLKKLLTDERILKILHFARFDMAVIKKYLGVDIKNVYCTKIASKIARTYSDAHGLKVLTQEFLGFELSKKQQSSYWGADEISKDQLKYAAGDVLYLHQIKAKLDEILEREGRTELVSECCKFLTTRVALDLGGWENYDIFAH